MAARVLKTDRQFAGWLSGVRYCYLSIRTKASRTEAPSSMEWTADISQQRIRGRPLVV